MKVGDSISAKTHAQFLNQLLGTNYKAWMKSSIVLSSGERVWMIELGDFISPSGWINKLTSANRLSEKHTDMNFQYEHDTYKNALKTGAYWDSSDRIVFDIVKGRFGRKYIFRGVFRINRTESTLSENVWDRIADKYNF